MRNVVKLVPPVDPRTHPDWNKKNAGVRRMSLAAYHSCLLAYNRKLERRRINVERCAVNDEITRNDPIYREARQERAHLNYLEKRNDPAFVAAHKERARLYYLKKCADPNYRQVLAERARRNRLKKAQAAKGGA